MPRLPGLVSSLQARLVAGFAAVLAVALLSVAWYVSAESGREARRSEAQRATVRVERLQDSVAEHLARGHGWADIQPSVEGWGRLLSARVLVWDSDRRLVADSHRRLGPPARRSTRELEAQPVVRDGAVIGAVALMPLRPSGLQSRSEPVDSDLADHTARALLWAALAVGGAGIVAVGVLSRRVLSPVRALAVAAERLGRGDLTQRVAPGAGDEVGRLGEAFNRMAEDLEEAQRQRRSLLADVAHELRTPLYNIGGYVEAMRDGLTDRGDETLEVVQQQVAQLTRLVEDLRLLTLAESGSLELHIQPDSMGELLVSVAEAFEPRAAALGVSIGHAHASGVPAVLMDRGRVQQVLHNLIENAMTHTPPGGAVTLGLSTGEAGTVRVSVTDTGAGMDQQAVEAVFERFYRLDPSRSRATGGAGLGLTIAKQLIESQRGRIWARSEPGEGSTFIFELPPASTEEGA